MSTGRIKHLPVSVRQHLQNLRDKTGEDYQLLLTTYALERLLYRLSQSKYADRFVLKGAMLFVALTGKSHRVTRDLDLLGYGDASAEHIVQVFRQISTTSVEPDGMIFDPEGITVQAIREDQAYESQRVRLMAQLDTAVFPITVDIGFGDVVTPEAKHLTFPGLLDFPEPLVLAYPPETVVSEKLQALVYLGMRNSRMKDFYDLYLMARTFSFEGPVLIEAIRATFAQRKTYLPTDQPVALRKQFAEDSVKQTQWEGFLNRSGLSDAPMKLSTVVETLNTFLTPLLSAAEEGGGYNQVWRDGGPWRLSEVLGESDKIG